MTTPVHTTTQAELVSIKRLQNSFYGNPRFELEFEIDGQTHCTGITAPGAGWVYDITFGDVGKKFDIKWRVLRRGVVISQMEEVKVDTVWDVIDKAKAAGFSGNSIKIIRECDGQAVNPYRMFAGELRMSWAYAYFRRLEERGIIEFCEPPEGARGFHWYTLVK